MVSRRTFLASLAGLPVLGQFLQRAPLPSDTPTVMSGYAQTTATDARYATFTVTATSSGTVDVWHDFYPTYTR